MCEHICARHVGDDKSLGFGEAVWNAEKKQFDHVASLLIPADFASTQEAAARRRSRQTHKACCGRPPVASPISHPPVTFWLAAVCSTRVNFRALSTGRKLSGEARGA